jgi:hypothetical protein
MNSQEWDITIYQLSQLNFFLRMKTEMRSFYILSCVISFITGTIFCETVASLTSSYRLLYSYILLQYLINYAMLFRSVVWGIDSNVSVLVHDHVFHRIMLIIIKCLWL